MQSVVGETTAGLRHRDKDVPSSDIWILRHQTDSWCSAKKQQTQSVQLKQRIADFSVIPPHSSFASVQQGEAKFFLNIADGVMLALQQQRTLLRRGNSLSEAVHSKLSLNSVIFLAKFTDLTWRNATTVVQSSASLKHWVWNNHYRFIILITALTKPLFLKNLRIFASAVITIHTSIYLKKGKRVWC